MRSVTFPTALVECYDNQIQVGILLGLRRIDKRGVHGASRPAALSGVRLGAFMRSRKSAQRSSAIRITTREIADRLFIAPQDHRPSHPAHLRQDRHLDASRGGALGDAARGGQ
jgi:hypothetical protein